MNVTTETVSCQSISSDLFLMVQWHLKRYEAGFTLKKEQKAFNRWWAGYVGQCEYDKSPAMIEVAS